VHASSSKFLHTCQPSSQLQTVKKHHQLWSHVPNPRVWPRIKKKTAERSTLGSYSPWDQLKKIQRNLLFGHLVLNWDLSCPALPQHLLLPVLYLPPRIHSNHRILPKNITSVSSFICLQGTVLWSSSLGSMPIHSVTYSGNSPLCSSFHVVPAWIPFLCILILSILHPPAHTARMKKPTPKGLHWSHSVGLSLEIFFIHLCSTDCLSPLQFAPTSQK
jgi:hypothetical protein